MCDQDFFLWIPPISGNIHGNKIPISNVTYLLSLSMIVGDEFVYPATDLLCKGKKRAHFESIRVAFFRLTEFFRVDSLNLDV